MKKKKVKLQFNWRSKSYQSCKINIYEKRYGKKYNFIKKT